MLKQKYAADLIHNVINKDDNHEKRNNREVVNRWDKPPGVKTILSIWCFRRKRFPYGRINNHKAQLYSRGGIQQYEVNYWETYCCIPP